MFSRATQAYNWFYNKTLVFSGRNEKTRTMGVRYMAPSCIHFMHSNEEKVQGNQCNLPELSERILANGSHPTVQVVHKDGHWFTLNNLQLEVCRKLETDGRCDNVQVKVVNLKDVPQQMRRLMKVPQHADTDDTSRATATGYLRVDQSKTSERLSHDADDDEDDTSDDDDDDDDEFSDELSESDFEGSSTDDEEDSSDDESSLNGVNSNSGSSDNEEDTLL